MKLRLLSVGCLCICWALLALQPVDAAPFVPGTGSRVPNVGDDFEDPNWSYVFNNPKSSEENNEQVNAPGSKSRNGRWYEGVKRGHPDVVERVVTPFDGLRGSTGSLRLRTVQSGLPGYITRRVQQDDLVCNVHLRLGRKILVHESPSVVTHVFVPPFEDWEDRSGPHFGFRLALETSVTKKGKGFFAVSRAEKELYWPGMMLEFQSESDSKFERDSAFLRIRAGTSGGDFKGREVNQVGWWTLGMSVSPDGMVHYYAKPGIGRLSPRDHMTSQLPYGYRAKSLKTFFFDVVNYDDAQTWSTEWIIDDTYLYTIPRTAARP